MATYLKPRRGKKATAERILVGDAKLKKGEVFFEVNDNGVGKGPGKIKLGDGTSNYKDLPYFLEPGGNASSSTVEFTEASGTDGSTACTYDIKTKSSVSTLMTKIAGAIRNFHTRIAFLENKKIKLGRAIRVYTVINSNDSHYYLEGAIYVPAGTHSINMQISTNFGYVNNGRLVAGFFDTENNWYDLETLFPIRSNLWKFYSLTRTFYFSKNTWIYPAFKSINTVENIKDGVDPNTGRKVPDSLNGYSPIYKLSGNGTYICGGLPIYDSDSTDNDDTHFIKKLNGLFYKCDADGNIESSTSGISTLVGKFIQTRSIESTESYKLYNGDCRIKFRLIARRENTYEQKYDNDISSTDINDEFESLKVVDESGNNVQGSMPTNDE